jgi:hypothetical protein
MIQRIQTILLLLATAAAFLTLKFSFSSGNSIAADQTKKFGHLTAAGYPLLLVLTIAVGIAAFISVFLYKNRRLQLRIIFATMIISLLNLVLYYYQTQKFTEGSYDLSALIALAIPIFLLLAIRGIYKDQKLIKSLDRLR